VIFVLTASRVVASTARKQDIEFVAVAQLERFDINVGSSSEMPYFV
jgi:hypothetical protein